MISHRHRCIFVHIPKTGGTSIEALLWPKERTPAELWMGFVDKYHNKYQTGGLQHLLASQIRQEVGDATFAQYYKFSIVRNPWDKAVSQFSDIARRPDLRAFIGMNAGDSFKRYLELTTKTRHVQWEPQINFLYDGAGKLLVDYVGRFEAFAESVLRVLETLGVRAKKLPHENKTARRDYVSYYDSEAREMIAEMYRGDIEAFGYQFGATPALTL